MIAELRKLGGILLVACFVPFSAAQVSVGTPPFGSFTGGPDVVNLGNLNAHLGIPVTSKAGRGLNFSFSLTFDSSVWYPLSGSWKLVNNVGWSHSFGEGGGSIANTSTTNYCYSGGHPIGAWVVLSPWTYTDPLSTTHTFPASITIYSSCAGNPLTTGTVTTTATDGSGLSMTFVMGTPSGGSVSITSITAKNANGDLITPSGVGSGGPAPFYGNPIVVYASTQDTNGNMVTVNNGVYSDTLGTTALTVTAPAIGDGEADFTYTGPGGSSPKVAVIYKKYNVQTKFSCQNISEYNVANVPLVDKVNLPDGRFYQFQYEATKGVTGYVTGRVASVTLPTGGQVSYQYTLSDGTIPPDKNPITCADGAAQGMTRTTPDGTWTYLRTGSGTQWTTTVTDPSAQSNKTVIAFTTGTAPNSTVKNFYETSRTIYQGTVDPSHILRTTTTKYYFGSSSAPPSTSITLPITRSTVTTASEGGTTLGNLDTYWWIPGIFAQQTTVTDSRGGGTLQTVSTTYAGATTRPASVTLSDGSGQVSQISYYYDETTPTPTTSTPQHTNTLSGPRYNLTTVKVSTGETVQGQTYYLTTTNSYYDTGNPGSTTDPAGGITTFTYGACGNSFVTNTALPSPTPSVPLNTQTTWDQNCTGAVPVATTDINGNTSTFNYTDPNYWRVTSVTDAFGNTVTRSYPTSTNNASETVQNFNSGNSTRDVITRYDTLGRTQLVEVRQAPASSTFDIVATNYDSLGRVYQTSIPYGNSEGTLDFSKSTTYLYDPLNRPTLVTDPGSGTTAYSYSKNDVLITAGPAPTFPIAENVKQRQQEYDFLGRLVSVCELTAGTQNAPSGACGQQTSGTGYLTKYQYANAGHSLTVKQNAQNAQATQTRTVSRDQVGRKWREVNPESGTTTYTYDYDASYNCPGLYPGDLIRIDDAVGNKTCFTYDSLHRLLTRKVKAGSPYASVTPDMYYVYDAATLNGTAMQNVKGRLAEAYTCSGSCTNHDTDAYFSSFPEMSGDSPTGKIIAQLYEKTPHSGNFYLTQETYHPNGALSNAYASLNGASIGVPHLNYGLDGEGHPKTVTDSDHSLNLVTNAQYNAASLGTQITYGNGDSDTFAYDQNTYRPTGYTFSITGSSAFTQTGTLTWNPLGTPKQLVIADTSDATKNENCTYSADDLVRIAAVTCNGGWTQTFTYDAFGNIKKSGSSNYQPSGYDPLTNRVLGGVPASYDANGNMLTDSPAFAFAWSAANVPITINSTIGATYDALGRVVESASGAAYTQFIYRASGDKLAQMNGSTLVKAAMPLPGGGTAVYNNTGFSHLRHKDWLGSSRLATKWDHSVYAKESYAPFGETYNENATGDRSFTGQDQDTTQGLYDFLFRRHNPISGRWISPDPAGWDAVDPADPQSLDRYAYVRNSPMVYVDPDGTSACYDFPGQAQCGIPGYYDASYGGQAFMGPPSIPLGGGLSQEPASVGYQFGSDIKSIPDWYWAEVNRAWCKDPECSNLPVFLRSYIEEEIDPVTGKPTGRKFGNWEKFLTAMRIAPPDFGKLLPPQGPPGCGEQFGQAVSDWSEALMTYLTEHPNSPPPSQLLVTPQWLYVYTCRSGL